MPRPRRTITDERLVELVDAGWSTAKIAAECGASKAWVGRLRKRLGIAAPEGLPRTTNDEWIVELTRAGWSAEQIGAEVGCTPRTVHRARERSGISQPRRLPWTEQEFATVERLLDDGASIAEAARSIGRSPRWLYDRYPGRSWTHQQSGQWARYCERMKAQGLSI
jgi:AraC-like DNA-binding protein